jgi:hypothetical protein
MGYQSWGGPPFGGTNLDFAGGILNIKYEKRKMNFSETNGVMCDKNGKLLFSSNGIYIANAQNDTMQNGSGLNPCSFTTRHDSLGLTIPQANLIIPFPGDSSKYYLFHQTCDDYDHTYCAFYLYYSVIDMSFDSGKGAVIQKNVILLSDQLIDGRLTACKHANGRDWWLISHQFNTNKYYKYLITPLGIQGPYPQYIGAKRDVYFGQVAFSPDGEKFAYYEPFGDLDLMDFDRCTGDFSNALHVNFNDSAFSGGVAFSANSKVLYVSSMNYIYQFDLTANDVLASQTTIATWDGYYSPEPPLASIFYLAQLAPDGKIYINCANATLDIHVINNPDIVGLGCNVCQHCIHLPAYNAFTIPNHPNYFLGAETGSVCDSLTAVQNITVQSSKLEVYPNPSVTDDITFTYNVSSEPGIINVYNIEGKEVMHYTIPQWSSVQHLKLPKFSNGIYMARLTQGKKISSVKFLKE